MAYGGEVIQKIMTMRTGLEGGDNMHFDNNVMTKKNID
jgi:hypothetical protein